jgi:phosphoribosylaminoimidazolecarboxamide formyltransferase/IMP cyclohydrolase
VAYKQQCGDVKRVGSGLLMQTADNHAGWPTTASSASCSPRRLSCGTCCLPGKWPVRQVQRHRVCAGGMTLGVGAGQTRHRLGVAGAGSLAGLTAVASDAFSRS